MTEFGRTSCEQVTEKQKNKNKNLYNAAMSIALTFKLKAN